MFEFVNGRGAGVAGMRNVVPEESSRSMGMAEEAWLSRLENDR